jgi:hypothetical protein
VGRALRWISYAVALTGIATVLWSEFGTGNSTRPSAGGSVAAMGSIGRGVGEAVVFFIGMAAVTVASALINGLSLHLTPSPASTWRKVEFGVFLLPLALTAVAFLSFVYRW